MMRDANKKAYYRQRAKTLCLPNAYTAALTDYMRSPKLTQVRTTDDTTLCKVSKKDFALTHVTVTVHDENGAVKETRNIHESGANSYAFSLTSQQRRYGVTLNALDSAGRIKRWQITDHQT